MNPFDVSIIVCTHNRAESLRTTLESMIQADRAGISVEVVIADSASSDHTRQVVEEMQRRIPLRYVYVPVAGKSNALNGGLALGSFGTILAFLDDDLTLHRDWFQAVKAGAERWNDCDLFTGNSYVVWPSDPVPTWAAGGDLDMMAFSVMNWGAEDRLLAPSNIPGGGHCWIRSRVLKSGIRFDRPMTEAFASTGYASDPDFLAQLLACGLRGAAIHRAVVGHRIQEGLLRLENVRKRIATTGRANAYIRQTYPQLFWQAKLFRDHCILSLALCAFNAVRWGAAYLVESVRPQKSGRQMAKRLGSLCSLYKNLEVLTQWPRLRRKLRENTSKVERLLPELAPMAAAHH